MAVRLACPACGKAFSPRPADAGRVIPCARCGSDLQMPDAVPPTAKAVAKRPAREPDDYEEAPRPAKPARGTPLLLLTLLASGVTGLLLGASVFYFALRDRPAEPVAQKPADPPAVEQPKPEPPKPDPPKPEPKPDAPKPAPKPQPLPPKGNAPRVPGVPGAPGAVVAADTIPGLKFYLACDRVADDKVFEAVSGKPVGTGFGLVVTDGPRGDALRLSHDRKDANRFALDVSDAKGQLAVPAGRPFTLAFWARRVHTDALSGFGAFVFDASSDHADRHARALRLQLLPATPALVAADLLDMPDRGNQGTAKSVTPTFRVADPSAWAHVALVRDAGGGVRLLVNGREAPDARNLTFPGELRYDQIGVLRSAEGKTTIDLDELCLFDRALTPDELGGLSGSKAAPPPKPPVVAEAKLPPPGRVPPADAFKGLKFYLSCDALDNGTLAEAVSGKNVGAGKRLQAVDGPRGKAVRGTVGGLGAGREGFELAASADALAVEEGKPFTLAMWVRTDDWESFGGRFIDAKLSAADKSRTLALYRYTKGVGFLLQQGKPGGRPDPINQLARGTFEMPPKKDWIHLALTRDDRGVVRLAVDGEVVTTAPGAYTAEVRFTTFTLLWQQGANFTADFDEFCLFDRVLADNELALLAGRKGKGQVAVKPEEKEPPKPPVPPKEPLPVAPPPRAVGVAEPHVIAPKGPLPVAPPPRVAVAAVVEPPVIAPKVPPKEPAAVAVSAPAGVDPKGLLLYLPFEESKDGAVREGVSGRFAGKCDGLELVKGARGNAVRLAARADGELAPRLDLGDVAERATVPEGKPFALALWLRVEGRDGARASGTAVQFGVRPDREYDRAVQVGFGAGGTLHCTARSTPDRLDGKRETAARWVGVANPAKWQHLAMVRDEKNVVRWYVNGKAVPQPGKPDPVWSGPLGFDRLFVGDPEQAKAILEVDELCVFARPLTADELKKLAESPK